jgi:HEAT repeat protein
MTIARYLQTIGAREHKLAMSDLKPLSGLGREEREAFWQAWQRIAPARRDEIARAMVDLAEDNVDLDFGEVLFWCLDDDDAGVRVCAVEGLWENESPRLLHRLLVLLRSDPAPDVRTAAAIALSREDARELQDTLLAIIRDQQQPFDARRRSLESAGYFAEAEEVQRQIDLAYRTDEQLLRESALVAMGRSMLPRWLPIIARELASPSPALRYEAARAAGEMAEEARALLPKLIPLLDDSDSEVAFAAIWALGQIGGEAARRALQRVRKSQDEARSQAASEALEELALEDGLFG